MSHTLGQVDIPLNALIFRSNVTPDLILDLTQFFTPGVTPPDTAVSGNSSALQFIKPEIVLQAFGLEADVAPYGQPQAGMFIYIVGGLVLAALLSGLVTYAICRNLGGSKNKLKRK